MKPGWKSTEFWLTLVINLASGLVALGIVGEGTKLGQGLALGVATLTTLGYTGFRSGVKKAASSAVDGAKEVGRKVATASLSAARDAVTEELEARLPDKVKEEILKATLRRLDREADKALDWVKTFEAPTLDPSVWKPRSKAWMGDNREGPR